MGHQCLDWYKKMRAESLQPPGAFLAGISLWLVFFFCFFFCFFVLFCFFFFFFSEVHWNCSCEYPDPRRILKLTSLFHEAGADPELTLAVLAWLPLPLPFGVIAECILKRRDSVCLLLSSSYPQIWVRRTLSLWEDRFQDQLLVPCN